MLDSEKSASVNYTPNPIQGFDTPPLPVNIETPVAYHTHDGVDSPEIEAGTPGGDNTEFQFNDNGDFGGIPTATYDKDTGNIVIQAGNINGTFGDVEIRGSDADVNGIAGGVIISGGENDTGQGGDVSISGGAGASGPGAGVAFIATDANGVGDFDGGNLSMTLGRATGTGERGKLIVRVPTGTTGENPVNFLFDQIEDTREYSFMDTSSFIPTTLLTSTADVTVEDDNDAGSLGGFTLFPTMQTAGRVFRISAWGILSTAASGSRNFNIFIGPSSATSIPFPDGLNDVPWKVEAMVTVRTTGITGSWIGNGFFEYLTDDTGTPEVISITGSGTRNTTTSTGLGIIAGWSIASPDNSITCNQILIEALN